ncbi:class I SAM-dependent methyltransferase [candidate division WWE3 bacterium]|uniref:Class I SAM-dependent methyltransferase n=1 Tax=candidate division WWE3 bacterium TaxID=2053526 RepID=A0A955EEK0_UNCKA|nr:class I SAM-dependent methyltransferase [candidate division WWE3 bacterium]
MKEYTGENVKNYRQPSDKYVRLFPAIKTALDTYATQQSNVLDLGCGDGILYSLFFNDAKYSYTGIDLSGDMVAQAKSKNPNGNFVVGDATNLPKDSLYDLVIANMLFPSISDFANFTAVFEQVSKVLKPNGYFIATIINPFLDGYMQAELFNRTDIETEFKGYYESGARYLAHRDIDGVKFTFEDYHWQLSDYIKAGYKSSLALINIDECVPIKIENVNPIKILKMQSIPTYLVLVFCNSRV